jgi:chemotaxis protein CheD
MRPLSSRAAVADEETADPPAQVFLTPGSLYCGTTPAIVSTVLGSCVAVCLSDRYHRAAGMNHYVLPRSPTGERSLRYGDVAMTRLRERLTRSGCAVRDLRAKVFGGAAVLSFGEGEDSVGAQNVRTALEWLHHHSIPVVAQRTGGSRGLLIRLDSPSGRVLVRRVPAHSGA